jgi:hypothetical protein
VTKPSGRAACGALKAVNSGFFLKDIRTFVVLKQSNRNY